MRLYLAAALLLAACGPRVSYELVPPQTESGRACANQCLNGLSQCEAACKREQNSCEMFRFADRAFDASPYLGDDMFDDDCEPDLCYERCAGKHRICHANCGGQVIKRTSPR